MSGIAGIIALREDCPVLPDRLQAMGAAIHHRGPDGTDCHVEPKIGMVRKNLHPIPVPVRQQALTNASGSVVVAFHGRMLGSSGQPARAMPDAEWAAQLWEERGPGMFALFRGPFALALWDRRGRSLVLARDRIGIAPLYWAQQNGWFLFGSEIKAILASGLVAAAPDVFGIDHVFCFMGMPGARTCFKDIHALWPGHYLRLSLDNGPSVCPQVKQYWDLDFPDQGQEQSVSSAESGADQLEGLLTEAVSRRLTPGEPVASYISGGVDCSTLVALAGKVRGEPLPTFTVRMDSPRLDESERTLRVAQACGREPVVLSCNRVAMQQALPRLILASEHPLMDASCGTLLLLAESVRQHGFRVVLGGDGSDDLFAGYPWFRIDRLLGLLDRMPGVKPSAWIRRLALKLNAPQMSWQKAQEVHALVGGHNPWLDLYGVIGMARFSLYSEETRAALEDRLALADFQFPLERMRRWHPLNRGLYFGMKMHVAGLLLQGKGDRIAMHSGLELRHPFLDEDVVEFARKLHPTWKLHYLRDKYLLRHVAARWLPKDIAWRPKHDFVAPFDCMFGADAPEFVQQLLSEESLRRTGYFNVAAVQHWRQHYAQLGRLSGFKISVQMALAGVVGTQLWHHTFIDPGLADLPHWQPAGGRKEMEPAALNTNGVRSLFSNNGT